MVALLLRLDVSGVTVFIHITVQAPCCLIMAIYKHNQSSTVGVRRNSSASQ